MYRHIYKLDLHEAVEITVEGVLTTVLRVPGGWIYYLRPSTNPFSSDFKDAAVTSIFVPFNNEFQ